MQTWNAVSDTQRKFPQDSKYLFLTKCQEFLKFMSHKVQWVLGKLAKIPVSKFSAPDSDLEYELFVGARDGHIFFIISWGEASYNVGRLLQLLQQRRRALYPGRSNLVSRPFVQPNSNGLQPTSDGFHPNSITCTHEQRWFLRSPTFFCSRGLWHWKLLKGSVQARESI